MNIKLLNSFDKLYISFNKKNINEIGKVFETGISYVNNKQVDNYNIQLVVGKDIDTYEFFVDVGIKTKTGTLYYYNKNIGKLEDIVNGVELKKESENSSYDLSKHIIISEFFRTTIAGTKEGVYHFVEDYKFKIENPDYNIENIGIEIKRDLEQLNSAFSSKYNISYQVLNINEIEDSGFYKTKIKEHFEKFYMTPFIIDNLNDIGIIRLFFNELKILYPYVDLIYFKGSNIKEFKKKEYNKETYTKNLLDLMLKYFSINNFLNKFNFESYKELKQHANIWKLNNHENLFNYMYLDDMKDIVVDYRKLFKDFITK